MNTEIVKQDAFSEQFMEAVRDESSYFYLLKKEVANVVVGNEQIVDFIIIGLLCNGHVLLEGVPGVAKTTIIKTITQALGLHFKRIQFTPDLLPSDLIGTLVYNPKTQEFETKKGPIFANLILADEINRAPAKVQAALLEAMQEQQVTIGSTTFALEKPFFVLATQNPIEQEGTYVLPEAQVDRFMFKLLVGYLTQNQEKNLLLKSPQEHVVQQIISKEVLFNAQEIVKNIYVDHKIIDYIMDIVFATRMPEQFNIKNATNYIASGVSPRATLALHKAAQAHAFLKKRHFVTPDDIKMVAPAILRHRITLSHEAQLENITTDDVIKIILSSVPTP